MDDDTVFQKDVVTEMIKFWNNIPSDTAGVDLISITNLLIIIIG